MAADALALTTRGAVGATVQGDEAREDGTGAAVAVEQHVQVRVAAAKAVTGALRAVVVDTAADRICQYHHVFALRAFFGYHTKADDATGVVCSRVSL